MTNPSSTSGPHGELKQAVEEAFGSVDAMKEKFNAAAAGELGRCLCRVGKQLGGLPRGQGFCG